MNGHARGGGRGGGAQRPRPRRLRIFYFHASKAERAGGKVLLRGARGAALLDGGDPGGVGRGDGAAVARGALRVGGRACAAGAQAEGA